VNGLRRTLRLFSRVNGILSLDCYALGKLIIELFLFEIPGKCCERYRIVASVESFTEHSLEDCLDRQRATAIYIVGGWVCHDFNSQELAAFTVPLG
jgi:hypothetical protein